MISMPPASSVMRPARLHTHRPTVCYGHMHSSPVAFIILRDRIGVVRNHNGVQFGQQPYPGSLCLRIDPHSVSCYRKPLLNFQSELLLGFDKAGYGAEFPES